VLQAEATKLAATAAQQDDDASPWRYKTFYYSSSPSWEQLQQLQQQHVANCRAACQQPHPTEQQQQQGVGADGRQGLVPLAQLQQLQARQQLLSKLLVQAAGQKQHEACSLQSKQQHCQMMNGCRNRQQQQQQQEEVSMDASEQEQIQQANGNLQEQCNWCCQPQQEHCYQQQQQQQQQQQRHCAGLVSVHMSANLFEGGTGCHMWDAGFLLAEWLLNHQRLVSGAGFFEASISQQKETTSAFAV
jgi:hypothetical protein